LLLPATTMRCRKYSFSGVCIQQIGIAVVVSDGFPTKIVVILSMDNIGEGIGGDKITNINLNINIDLTSIIKWTIIVLAYTYIIQTV
jgi:hypothetical protein